MTFAERFQWIFDERGTTANDLSVRAKLSRDYIRKLVKREEQALANPAIKLRPGWDAIDALAREANVSAKWLMTGVEPREPYGSVANEVEGSPKPPPVSGTVLVLDRPKEILNSVYDKSIHDPDDMVLAMGGLRVAAALTKGMDPRRYVKLLLDTAAECRTKGIKVTAVQLPALALGAVVKELDEASAENERLREHIARADQLLREQHFPAPVEGEGPHEAFLEAREKMLGIPAKATKPTPTRGTKAEPFKSSKK